MTGQSVASRLSMTAVRVLAPGLAVVAVAVAAPVVLVLAGSTERAFGSLNHLVSPYLPPSAWGLLPLHQRHQRPPQARLRQPSCHLMRAKGQMLMARVQLHL